MNELVMKYLLNLFSLCMMINIVYSINLIGSLSKLSTFQGQDAASLEKCADKIPLGCPPADGRRLCPGQGCQ